MKIKIAALSFFLAVTANASSESLFESIASVSGTAQAMGGKLFTVMENLHCVIDSDTEEVSCTFINTDGKNRRVENGAKDLLEELISANAISYAGSGAGRANYWAKSLRCSTTETTAYQCHVELTLDN